MTSLDTRLAELDDPWSPVGHVSRAELAAYYALYRVDDGLLNDHVAGSDLRHAYVQVVAEKGYAATLGDLRRALHERLGVPL